MSLKDMIREMVERELQSALSEMMGNASEPAAEPAKVDNGRKRRANSGTFPKGPRVMYVTARRMGKRELDDMRPNDRRAYDYVAKHGPCSAAEVEAGTGLGRKATESALWSLRKGNNAGAIKSKPVA